DSSQNSELGITKINTSQRRSIGVEFGNNFSMDLVPSIEYKKDESYKVFDKRTLEAIHSNPKYHGKLLSEANDKLNGKLVPIIKLLKSWRRSKCEYVKSFHLEILAVQVLKNEQIDT